MFKIFTILALSTSLILSFTAYHILDNQKSTVELVASLKPENKKLLIESECLLFSDSQLENGVRVEQTKPTAFEEYNSLVLKNGKTEKLVETRCVTSSLAEDFVKQQRFYNVIKKESNVGSVLESKTNDKNSTNEPVIKNS